MPENGKNEEKDRFEEALSVLSRYCETADEEKEELAVVEFDLAEEPCDMVAVDGSYTFLLHMSSIWLGVVKLCALTYRHDNGRYERRGRLFVEEPVVLSTNRSIVEQQDELLQNLFRQTKGSSDQVNEMMNKYRAYKEQEIAMDIAKKCRDSIVALDGTLSFSKQLGLMEELREVCEENDNVLVGISKDSYTHAFNSTRTDEELLESIDSVGRKRGFIRVPSSFEEMQKGVLYGDVYFAKLHPDAPKWFRADLGTHRDAPSFVFSQLSNYSMSAICPGYPFPLLEAHRFAVTVRQFRILYEERIMKLVLKYSLSPKRILKGLTHIEGKPKGSFHEYLDKLAREAK